jgi:hypothetical protein
MSIARPTDSSHSEVSTIEFLRLLYPKDAPAWLPLWTRQRKRTDWFKGASDLEAAALRAQRLSQQPRKGRPDGTLPQN